MAAGGSKKNSKFKQFSWEFLAESVGTGCIVRVARHEAKTFRNLNLEFPDDIERNEVKIVR
jgi:hypothetical protein